MEQRLLGGSGFSVPVLCFGTATFGGGNEVFRAWGDTQLASVGGLPRAQPTASADSEVLSGPLTPWPSR